MQGFRRYQLETQSLERKEEILFAQYKEAMQRRMLDKQVLERLRPEVEIATMHEWNGYPEQLSRMGEKGVRNTAVGYPVFGDSLIGREDDVFWPYHFWWTPVRDYVYVQRTRPVRFLGYRWPNRSISIDFARFHGEFQRLRDRINSTMRCCRLPII
jgi:hypothetical protein